MPLNTTQFDTLDRQLQDIDQIIDQVELFFVGVPVSAVRIEDASITSAKIADLSVTNAKFADLAITNAKINNVDASKFTAGTLSADRIASASITADKLNVTELSAISANVGTITSGTLTGLTVTGGTIRTNSSGTRVEMTASPNALRIFDGSTEKIRIDPEGLKLSNLGINFISGSTFKGAFFTDTSPDEVIFEAGNCDELFIVNGKSGGDIQIVAADDTINMTATSIKVNGATKTAIVPTSRGYNALYTLESPEVWFFDFVKSLDDIDPMFLETTEGESNVLLTDQGEYLVFRHRKGFKKTRFEEKTLQQFDRNNKFWNQV